MMTKEERRKELEAREAQWVALSKLRWDTALADLLPGIVTDGRHPTPATIIAARDPAERQAIQEADGIGDRPAPWRATLADWPDEWRERWGRLANERQGAGCDWWEAERKAFVAVKKLKRRTPQGATP